MIVTASIVAFFLMIGMMLIGIPIAVSMFIVGAGGGLLAFGRPSSIPSLRSSGACRTRTC